MHRIAAVLLQVMHGDQRRAQRVHDPFANFVTIAINHGGVRHQMADVAHQHQAAAFQGDVATIHRLKGQIWV